MSCLSVLKEKGLKLTPQRRLIVELIHDRQGHLTAEEIINSVQNKMPGVNKSTVYRTLELLEKSGCVYKSELDNQSIYHHADEGHHHHLVCSSCGKKIDCDEDLFATVEQAILKRHNFSVDFRHVVMNGICDKCRRNSR